MEVEGSIGQKLAYLLSDTAAPGLIRIIPRKNQSENIVDVAEVN